MPILRQTATQEVLPRLFLVALGIAAIEPGRSSIALLVVTLSFAYLVLAIGLLAARRLLLAESRANVALVLDVAFVSLLAGLAQPSPLPLWALYLLPLIVAMRSGRLPLAIATGLSIAGLLLVDALTGSLTWSATGWPIVVLVIAALALAVTSQEMDAERAEICALHQISSTIDVLADRSEPDDLAAGIVADARALLEADDAWLWWYTPEGELVSALSDANRVDGVDSPKRLPREIDEQLTRGPVPLRMLGNTYRDQGGEVWLLARGERRVALLALAWQQLPPGAQTRRQQLPTFTSWAAGALVQAQTMLATRQELRRTQLLRDVAVSLATTLDETRVREVVVAAAGEALVRDVFCVERGSGRVVAGTEPVAEELRHAALLLANSPEETDSATAPVARRTSALVRSLDENLVLVVDTEDSVLLEADVAWLDALVQVTRESLSRCATYEQNRRSEQHLRQVLDALPSPVVVWDRQGQRVLANRAYQALPLEAAPATGLPTDGLSEEEFVVGDPPRTFVVTRVPLDDPGLVLAYYREVTRERQALQAKDELIAVIGHELRTPLTSIHGYSQMMARQLSVVQDQVNRLNHMIADFLVAARLEDGRLPITREVVDLVGLAREAAERFRGANQDCPLSLHLPDQAFVEGDSGRLSQVLDNLLNNAAKYSPPGQEITLTIKRDPRESEVLLAVRDHGIGIAAEHLPRLFDRFYRAPNTETQQVKGLGLGLSIVRDLVVAHGGRVWCESEGVGQGSTFWVSLQAATDANDGSSPEAANQNTAPDESEVRHSTPSATQWPEA